MFDQFRGRKPTSLIPLFILGACVAASVVVFVIAAVMNNRPSEPDHFVAEPLTFDSPSPAPIEQPWHPVELPGMSLEVPDDLKVTGDDRQGSALSSTWGVTWQPGALPDEDSAGVIATQMANAIGGTVFGHKAATLGGAPALEFTIRGRGQFTTVAFGTCGGRVVQLLSTAGYPSFERARNSMRCTSKAEAPAYGVVVDQRPTWHRANKSGGVLVANDADVVISLSAVMLDAEPTLVTMAAAMHFEVSDHADHHGSYAIRRGAVTLDDGAHPAAIVSWRCEAQHTLGVAYVSALGRGKLDDGIALAETGRCLGANEPLPEWLRPR